MKIKTVLFDIYKTLLAVSPPPEDAEERWTKLCKQTLPDEPPLTLADFRTRCREFIDRDHAAAHAQGISYPEVVWSDIVTRVLPSTAKLSQTRRANLLYEQIQLWHTVRFAPGAATVLKRLARAKIPLGIVSNCQPYTLRELDRALAAAGIGRSMFARDLIFLSFEQGFSKPDPHVFRLLTARLAARGMKPADALVVGDRADNDIAPARAQGFQTWLLTPATARAKNSGTWPQLGAALPKFQ